MSLKAPDPLLVDKFRHVYDRIEVAHTGIVGGKSLQNGLYFVSRGRFSGMIDEDGVEIIPLAFSGIEFLDEEFIIVSEQERLYSFFKFIRNKLDIPNLVVEIGVFKCDKRSFIDSVIIIIDISKYDWLFAILEKSDSYAGSCFADRPELNHPAVSSNGNTDHKKFLLLFCRFQFPISLLGLFYC